MENLDKFSGESNDFDTKMSPKEDTTKNAATVEPEPEITEALDEIESVNSTIDSLSNMLDNIEQKTDDIKTQLLALLMSNREILNELKEENANNSAKHNDEMEQ